MLEILKETTVWSDGSNANHTYLLDGTKIIAYAKSSDNSVQVLRTQIKIDKRYRTFIKAKHFGLQNLIKSTPTKSNTRVFKVKSKEKEYFVELSDYNYTCTCTGFNFRGKCKHIDAVAKKQQTLK
jgi:predicted nucleic acid-binding Zn finger protein